MRKSGYQEVISIAIHVIQLSAQGCSGKAQAPVSVHCALDIYTQRFCKCFLE